ncbi:MAG TPA: type VI secretion system baseplate subunit TssG [Pirellulales bacterium]|jgi:type VI secretion system protein ImpH|nr:type VI secretion system baseplate subunit TssG [Pirellulales bacterium]
MALPGGRQDADLTAASAAANPVPTAKPAGVAAQLLNEPYRFDFFQAVRVLARIFPRRQPVGHDGAASDEIVRFRSYMSLAFPPSEIHDMLPPVEPDGPPRMVVAFMGLTGPSAVLPRHYTELLLERARQKDRTLYDFLDLFHHRLVSLFYRAWEKCRFWAGFERVELEAEAWRSGGEDRYRAFVVDERPRRDLMSQVLLELGGLGSPATRYRARVRNRLAPRTALDDETFRFYAGLLAQQHRSAAGLEGMLNDYFEAPAAVEQFRGQWLQLEAENQSSLVRLGNICLGRNVVIGERFWDVQGKFRLRLGPLGYQTFRDFLPPGTAFRPLSHLARLYSGASFDVDVQLVLRAEEVPSCQLGNADGGSNLGWDTWIRTGPMTHDAADAVFTILN